MKGVRKSLNQIFTTKRGKQSTCAKLFSYVLLGGIICFMISAVMGPTNTKNTRVVEGLVNSRDSKTQGNKKMIFFHMDKCGHCVKFMPTWDDFCKKPPKKVKTEKLEMKHPRAKILIKEFGISGFPTVVMTDANDNLEDTFSGPRTVDGLTTFAQENL